MRIGLVGASGRLGGLIAAKLAAADALVTAIDTRGQDSPPDFEGFDAFVVAAPSQDVGVHRAALAQGCHVLDITVDTGVNQALLDLDNLALTAGRSVIAMAGLAPGLTGALAAQALETAGAHATRAVVALHQHPQGSAGKQGSRDMIDLLTRPRVRYRPRPVCTVDGGYAEARLFDLPNPEPLVTGLHDRLELVTGWDATRLNQAVRVLAVLRRVAPRPYAAARDLLASRKASSAAAAAEPIAVSVVAIDQQGHPLHGRHIQLRSDYGATAAITSAATIAAVEGRTHSGAGHLAHFLTADEILADSLLDSQLTGSATT
jgi:hypothetical protein